MASVQDYLKMMSTSQLEALLREECAGNGALPLDVILEICDLLAQRNPDKPDLKMTVRKICAEYYT